MTAMTHMAAVLGASRSTAARQHSASGPAALRRALVSGPKTARELEKATKIPAKEVRGMLNHHIRHGRIEVAPIGDGTRVRYALPDSAEVAEQLLAARKLIERYGYQMIEAPRP